MPAQQDKDEEDFEALVLGNLAEAETLLGYQFQGLRRLIATIGARAAACQLLNPANVGQSYAGFNKFIEAGLLDRSLEHAILNFPVRDFFPRAVIHTSNARLTIAKLKLARRAQAKK